VAELPAGAATLSDDIIIVEDLPARGAKRPEATASDSNTELRVDVDVTLGDDVEVDAYGLVANLTGDIGVSMRSPDPVNLSGSITVVDGIYKQYGQNLQASGDILFVGPVAATRLELQAVREIETENRILSVFRTLAWRRAARVMTPSSWSVGDSMTSCWSNTGAVYLTQRAPCTCATT